MFDNWVIDATMGWPPCCCPVEGDIRSSDFTIVTGMNFIGKPPGKLVAIVHADGQQAVYAFYREHKADIDDLFGKELEP